MKIIHMKVLKFTFYLLMVVFHWFFIFTNTGNYYHGGTLTEHILLQVVAASIVVIAFKLVPRVRALERVFVVVGTLLPAVCVGWALISVFI